MRACQMCQKENPQYCEHCGEALNPVNPPTPVEAAVPAGGSAPASGSVPPSAADANPTERAAGAPSAPEPSTAPIPDD
jgi:hypothetical protein